MRNKKKAEEPINIFSLEQTPLLKFFGGFYIEIRTLVTQLAPADELLPIKNHLLLILK